MFRNLDGTGTLHVGAHSRTCGTLTTRATITMIISVAGSMIIESFEVTV